MIKRINLFAGPGSGKSTTASSIFTQLKIAGREVELVTEYIKKWAYEDKVPRSFDQLYVFAKQVNREDALLREKVPLIITDSPILLNIAYSKFYGFEGVQQLIELSQLFDAKYPSLNIFLDRSVEYQQVGRYQDYRQALEFDSFLLEFLSSNLQSELVHFKVSDDIVSVIESKLND